MELWIGALNLGFLYAFMALGVFITFRIQNFPDMTVDGSFTSGAAIAAILIISGVNPFLAIIASFFIGAIAGTITGIIYTRLNINGMLAGILVMIGLYSINLHIMGRSNVPLLDQPSFVSFIESFNPGLPYEIWLFICMFIFMIIFWQLISIFFKTDLGVTFRATGDNPIMSSASGVNVPGLNILGIALANGLVGISGGLVAQYQGFADIGMGIGTIVFGLASVIIGESILRKKSIAIKIMSAIIGSIIYRLMIAVALYVGMNPIDLKLLTAVFVLLTLIISKLLSKTDKKKQTFNLLQNFKSKKKIVYGFIIGLAIVVIGYFGYGILGEAINPKKMLRIGIIQLSDHALLNITRDSFLEEMKNIGYIEGENVTYYIKDANGDMPTVNTIVDKFKMDKLDLIISISTGTTQSLINKIKDTPIIFATVANPFIINAGKSNKEHLPNVTGVYGFVNMDTTLIWVKKFFNRPIRIGTIWDPSQLNAVFNVESLQEACKTIHKDVTFVGITVNGSSEVLQATQSLIERKVDALVLVPDNIVYSAFESVVKTANSNFIPIFMNDVERIKDGALLAYGYDYAISGIQAAHLANRVLNGENIATIPFETYSRTTLAINLDVAKKLNIKIPPEVFSHTTRIEGLQPLKDGKIQKIGVVQFGVEPNVEICKEGVIHGLKEMGYVDKSNIEIIYKNANADFSMINSIIQDFIRQEVDIIMPLSTPCLQSAVQLVKNKPKQTVVFTYVYNPYSIGVGTAPDNHLPNITGVNCFPPVDKILELIRELFPNKKHIGIVWNSSESNSESVVKIYRQLANDYGFKIIESTVTSPAEVLEASRSLINKGAEIFLNPGDNTLNVSYDSFSKVAKENKIPLFSSDAELIEQGTLVAMGPDYGKTGYDGGKYLARVLNGENPADIPIHHTTETQLYINLDVAKELNYTFSPSILKRANKIIDKSKQSQSLNEQSNKNQKKLAVFLFNESVLLETTYKGFRNVLDNSGILNKFNMTLDIKNAQGDFNIAQSIADNIISQKYDYVVTISTPALQVMSQYNKKIPHIFGAVTDPYTLGVAKNPKEHQANITGVATFQPIQKTFEIMRRLFPNAKKVGIVWNPSEACSQACTQKAREFASKYNFTLIEVTVNNTSEVIDAANSLIDKKIDLFLTSGDNTVNLAIRTLANMFTKKYIPYFTNTSSDVELGVFCTVGADYYEVGKELGNMALKVLNGGNPKDIPINNFLPEKVSINQNLVKKYNVKIPNDINNLTKNL